LPEQALYLKWRPLTFGDVVGQDHITRTLRNSLKSGRVRHAYLFSGPRGTGKTTMARLLAKAVNCTHDDPQARPCNACPACIAVNEGRYLDLIEIDAATHTGVDDVRDLRDKIAFNPGEGRYKVYIIDEVHRFTGNAFDALLKTLEEPPDHAIFVLATTEIDKVPATIKSRCLQFEFRRVSLMEVADRLQIIAEAEELNIERGALEVIARQGTGSVRDSISLLDQIVTDPQESITLAGVQRILGTASDTAVRDLVAALVVEDIPHGLHVINTAIDTGSDPRQFGQQTVTHLRAILLAQTASADLVQASTEDRQLYQQQAASIGRGKLLRAIRAFNSAVNEYRGGWQPQLALELALIESARDPEPEPAPQPVPATAATQPAQSQPAAVEPPPEPSEPGTPPVIPASTVQERWGETLKALYRLNRSAPDVLKAYRVHHVDGNTVYLCTSDPFLFNRLDGHPEKLGIVERALSEVHRVRLLVRCVLVNEEGETAAPRAEDIDDPVLSLGVELGGQIRKEDDDI
jgi:DNA polymerase III subunit gamma/tau